MTTTALAPRPELLLASPLGSLDHYMQAIHAIPVLSAAEEIELATRFRQANDLDAAKRLVLSHLRFVVHVARGYAGYGLQLGDLIQEGNVGLMKAVKRFDPNVGVRLVSFAVHWIRAEIHEFVLRNWRLVRVATTKAQRLYGRDLSFDPDPADDEDYAPAAYLPSPNSDPALAVERVDTDSNDHDRLGAALAKLDERSRRILERRWLAEEKATLHELAAEYGVSAERVRQIEANAIGKLKKQLAPA
jgi:RNA polymerase sigma-32 factor